MFKKSLAVILSCIMMTIPVVSFAETTEAVETVEIVKIAETPETPEAPEIAETNQTAKTPEIAETAETAETIEIAETPETAETAENICEKISEPESAVILRAPASKFPFEYMYPEKLESIDGSQIKNEIISNGSGSGVGVVADN